MVDHAENPIGRLYLFLRHCKLSPAQTCHAAWVSYLGLGPGWGPDLWHAVAAVLDMPGQARAVTGRFTGHLDVDTVLAHLDRAEASLGVVSSLGQPLQGMTQHYDDGTLMALQLASSVIGPTHHEPTADAESREAIRQAANDLIDALRTDDSIPDDVKRVLFDHAEAILHALNLIDIGGAAVVIEERNRLIGRLETDPKLTAEVMSRPPLRRTVGKLLKSILLGATIAQTILQIPQDIAADLALTQAPTTVIAPAALDAPPVDEA